MRKNSGAVCCSLVVLLFALSTNVYGAIRAGNAGGSYAGSSKNSLALQQQYNDAMAAAAAEQAEAEPEAELPVRVADENLAEMIRRGDSNAGVNFTTLDACAMIYPDGEFVWDVPTMGNRAGGKPTCVAVVEMRFVGKGVTGDSMDLPVARAKLAAGDMIKCNISKFPQSSYLPEIESVVFPADEAPTRQDVVKAMNQEQKSKAGLKIAAGLLVGGIGGNLTGKNEAGKDGLFGTGKDKLKTTAIGAAAGAALMTASTFSGKVAGDMIMSAGVNAAAGGLVGNMSGTGDSVLRVEKCEGPSGQTTCLWGKIQAKSKLEDEIAKKKHYFYNYSSKLWMVCDKEESSMYKDCVSSSSYTPELVGDTKFSEFEQKDSNDKKTIINKLVKYSYDTENKYVSKMSDTGDYIKIDVGNIFRNTGSAKNVVILDFPEGKFGSKPDDWYKFRGENGKNITICLRDAKGKPGECNTEELRGMIDDFKPTQLNAEDGDLIDISNKARLGSTLKGAGVGGAVGGFSGYQGAQSDIAERLTLATREYNDSLEKVYCGTGKKFLNFYNDDVEIPLLQE